MGIDLRGGRETTNINSERFVNFSRCTRLWQDKILSIIHININKFPRC